MPDKFITLENLSQFKDLMEDEIDNIVAPEYDSSQQYELNDLCFYEHVLYRCVKATSGAFDSTAWVTFVVGEVLPDAYSFLKQKGATINSNIILAGIKDVNLYPNDTGSYCQLKEKRGNSVVVNQLVRNGDFHDSTIWSGQNASISMSGNVGTITFSGNDAKVINYINLPVIAGHKYLISATMKAADANSTPCLVQYLDVSGGFYAFDGTVTSWQTKSVIFTVDNVFSGAQIQIRNITAASAGDTTIQVKNVFLIDLTQWFGSNEAIPSDLLTHPENFFRYYQGSLAYNAGTLTNSNGQIVKTIGRNLFDKSTVVNGKYIYSDGQETTNASYAHSDYIKVIPNDKLYIKDTGIVVYADGLVGYDKDKNFVKTIPLTNESQYHLCVIHPNVVYIVVNMLATEIGTQCVSIYYSGESGYDQHYPYEVLDEVDTGLEVLRSAGSAHDVKKPSGTIVRNVSEYTFTGNESASYDSEYGFFSVYCGALAAKPWTTNVITPNYTSLVVLENDMETQIEGNGTNIRFTNHSLNGDTSALLASLAGKKYYYELAEPTTEQGTPFPETVAIDDFGTMQVETPSGTTFNGVPMGIYAEGITERDIVNNVPDVEGKLCAISNTMNGAYVVASTVLQYDKINVASISANTTFTLAVAPANCYPEYKAFITNTALSAITLTFTGVMSIITNDEDNVQILDNTISLSAGVEIEISIVNGKMVAVTF